MSLLLCLRPHPSIVTSTLDVVVVCERDVSHVLLLLVHPWIAVIYRYYPPVFFTPAGLAESRISNLE